MVEQMLHKLCPTCNLVMKHEMLCPLRQSKVFIRVQAAKRSIKLDVLITTCVAR